MKNFRSGKRWSLALLGIGFLLSGGVGLLRSRDGASPQIVRLNVDGSYLGIEMEDVTGESVTKYKLGSETGVIVRSVVKGSPADAAHLQENDVIIEYAGFPVFSTSQLVRMVADTPVGRTVGLTISREGQKLNLTIKTAERRESSPAAKLGLVPRSLDRQLENVRPWEGTLFRYDFPGAKDLAFSVIRPGRQELGATVETLTDQMADFLAVPGKKGVLVTSVTAGSPAAARLKAGDVITAIDGKPVSSPSGLAQAVAEKEPGSTTEFKVVREKEEITVSVELPKSNVIRRGIRI